MSITKQTKQTDANQHARFVRSAGERGPHPIPRKRQVNHQFHRIFSIKAGDRVVVAESQLEADAIFWAEGNPDIMTLTEQPMRIIGSLGTKPYVTLDLGVVCQSGEEIFYEIKPVSQLTQSDDGRQLPAHWRSIEAWCDANGHRCELLTDAQLSADATLIGNWRALLGLARMAAQANDTSLIDQLLQVISDYPHLCLDQLMSHVANRSETDVAACCALLLHRGEIEAQLHQSVFTRYTSMSIRA